MARASSPPVEVPGDQIHLVEKALEPGVAANRCIITAVTIPRMPPPSIERTRYFAMADLPVWFARCLLRKDTAPRLRVKIAEHGYR